MVCVLRWKTDGEEQGVIWTRARSEEPVWVAWSVACALAADLLKQQARVVGAEAKAEDEKSASGAPSAPPASTAPAPVEEKRTIEEAAEVLAGAATAPATGTGPQQSTALLWEGLGPGGPGNRHPGRLAQARVISVRVRSSLRKSRREWPQKCKPRRQFLLNVACAGKAWAPGQRGCPK